MHLAVFLADGFEEIEALTVVDLCRRAGITTDMVSIKEPSETALFVTGSHGIRVTADRLIGDLDFDALDMIVLPGGMPGTTNLEACEPLMAQVRAFDGEKRRLAAICAAPGIFGRMGLLEGRNATGHPSVTDALAGADVSQKDVVSDGHILTSRGMGTAIPFALKIVEIFTDKDKARSIGQGIVYGY